MLNYRRLNSVDALMAGRDRAQECTLYIHDNGLVEINQGNPQRNGFVRIDPTLWVNIGQMTLFEILEQPDILNIKNMLDLRKRLDYTNPTHYNTLRYGRVVIKCNKVTEQNVGRYFRSRYPSMIGYICVDNRLSISEPEGVVSD